MFSFYRPGGKHSTTATNKVHSFLTNNNIAYSIPTAGHYLIANTGDIKLVWFPKSNTAQLYIPGRKRKTIHIGESTEENILNFLTAYLKPASQ
jgi:hypothetical protein